MTEPDLTRLSRAADLIEMQAVLARYSTAVDAKRWDVLETVFVEGSVVDFTANGGIRAEYPAISDYIRDALASFAVCQHYFMNFVFEVDGDVGSGRFYCFTQMVTLTEGGESLLADGGYYDVTFIRTDEGWRVKEMISGLTWLDGDWPEGVPRPQWYGVSSDRY